MLTGKYSAENVPKGPRGQLFKQILPGLTPLLETMRQVGAGRGKTMSQVRLPCQAKSPTPQVFLPTFVTLWDLSMFEKGFGSLVQFVMTLAHP